MFCFQQCSNITIVPQLHTTKSPTGWGLASVGSTLSLPLFLHALCSHIRSPSFLLLLNDKSIHVLSEKLYKDLKKSRDVPPKQCRLTTKCTCNMMEILFHVPCKETHLFNFTHYLLTVFDFYTCLFFQCFLGMVIDKNEMIFFKPLLADYI